MNDWQGNLTQNKAQVLAKERSFPEIKIIDS